MILGKIMKHQASTIQNRTTGTKVLHGAHHETGNVLDHDIQEFFFRPWASRIGDDAECFWRVGSDDQIDQGEQCPKLYIEIIWMQSHCIERNLDASQTQDHCFLCRDQGQIDKCPAGHGLKFGVGSKPSHGAQHDEYSIDAVQG